MKKELAERLLHILYITDFLDKEIKKETDGKPSFCDDEYYHDKKILENASIEILENDEE